ncbi:hypothetical protein U1Q18_038896, partial [Sarracenia purpurea var. burkii]
TITTCMKLLTHPREQTEIRRVARGQPKVGRLSHYYRQSEKRNKTLKNKRPTQLKDKLDSTKSTTPNYSIRKLKPLLAPLQTKAISGSDPLKRQQQDTASNEKKPSSKTGSTTYDHQRQMRTPLSNTKTNS